MIENSNVDLIYDFIHTYNTAMIFGVVTILIGYIYFRNKIKITYLLDFLMIVNILILLFVLSAPHRYYSLANCINSIFR